MRYVPYHRLDGRPNLIVDGSPTDGTVLTETHWPGYPPPAESANDLSPRRPSGPDGERRNERPGAQVVYERLDLSDALRPVMAAA